LSSIDPVGMTKACTSVVVPKSSRMMATVHSAIKPRGGSGFATGRESAPFSSATVADFFCSTDNHCTGNLIFCLERSLLESRGHQFCASLRQALPPARRAGVLLHNFGRGRTGFDEDRRQPDDPRRPARNDRQYSSDGRLLPVRTLHSAAGSGVERRRIVAPLS